MGHLTTRDTYRSLGDRINWFTQRVSTSGTLYKILQVLYPEKEAKWVALLPVRPFTVKKAAKIWGTSKYKAEKLLDHLCDEALLVDSRDKGVQRFVAPPPTVGFIEFALIRTRGDTGRKYLSELYYQCMNVGEDFVRDLFHVTETKPGRVLIQEPVLTNDRMSHVLDYGRATHIVEEVGYTGLGLCYCCYKMFHAGRPYEINAPRDACPIFDNVARSPAQHGDYCKLISKEETMDTLKRSYANSLVQTGENVREHPVFIYNCCGCCCGALQATRQFSPIQPAATTNYIPDTSGDQCVGCGKCAGACLVLAISMEDGGNGEKCATVNKDIYLGRGVCARDCGVKAIHMERRSGQVITPVNSAHGFVLQAIEKGTLANLMFDNQVFSSHRAMAALFSTILELPPLKQTMISEQFKSAYLDRLSTAKREKG